jgi:hypothetical protein
MQLTLLNWRPVSKGALRGFATIKLGRSLKVSDVAVLRANGKAWANLPSKPMIASDGSPMRDAAGKMRYSAILEWTDRSVSDDFSESVVAAVEAAHPGDTE